MEELRNYKEELASIYGAMLSDIWNLIEKYGKDDRNCEVPKQFAERTLSKKGLCEVDINGYSYDVDKVSVEIRMGQKCLNIISDGLSYSVTEFESINAVLTAVYDYFLHRDEREKEMKEHLQKAIKFVEEHLLEHIWKETILVSLRAVEEYRCPIDNDIQTAISELLNEYGSDNDLQEDWFYDVEGWVDEEDVFWKLELDLS